jgi:hypothetical protein
MDAGGAERLGARLVGEVEECGLSEVSSTIKDQVHVLTKTSS